MVCHMYGSRFLPLPHLWEKLSGNFYDYINSNVWPPKSPDRNPMDYYVCGAVEKDTNSRASTTKAQLIDRINFVFETLPR